MFPVPFKNFQNGYIFHSKKKPRGKTDTAKTLFYQSSAVFLWQNSGESSVLGSASCGNKAQSFTLIPLINRSVSFCP